MRKFRYPKRLNCILITMMGAVSLCSCAGSISYTEEQEDIIANYAAEVVLKHDVNFKYNYIDSVSNEKAAEETTTYIEVENPTIEQSTDGNGSTGSTGSSGDITGYELSDSAAISEAFELPSGITAEFTDYEVTDVYPKDKSDAVFVMKAVSDSNLLVLKFKITNTTSTDIDVNFMANERKYRGIVDNAKKYNAQLTLLSDALNTYEGKISANSSMELVLIYQTQIDTKEDVNSLSVSVSDNTGNEKTIYLK